MVSLKLLIMFLKGYKKINKKTVVNKEDRKLAATLAYC